MSTVSDTGILTTLAAISMSFAGFAGLIITLRGRGADGWGAFELFQLNIVLIYAFATLFGSLGVIVVAGIIGDEWTLRLGAALLFAVALAMGLRQRSRIRVINPGQPFRDAFPFIAFGYAQMLTFLIVVAFPRLQLFELGLLLMLAVPALVFRYVLRLLGSTKT